MLKSLVVLVTSLFAATLSVADAQGGGIQAGADIIRERTGAPGIGILIRQGDEIELGLSGVRAIGTDIALQPDDLWHLGSNTKSMTATLVARLVEQGRISWDDTIAQYLGEAVDDINPAYRELTFRHLLSHRSGLPANVSSTAMIGFLAQGAQGADIAPQRIAYAAQVLAGDPAAEPETEFLYSNAGYVVAGAMLEQATGDDWEVLIRREVFEPLGLTSAGFGAPGSAETVDQPRGHRSGLLGRRAAYAPGPTSDNPPVLGPAGTVHMSLGDLSGYLAVHMAGARGEDTGFLDAGSWQILHTPPFGEHYAMGWAIDGPRLIHNGSNTLWLVQMTIWPDRNRAVIIGANDGDAEALGPYFNRATGEAMSE
ncbi:serine hydrolase domain-containing protein [Maricaulis maris]|uniref:serine hydrolase domain-containing protein n=1 Tax=Maricaulis maris TaxID=74318 RepID=UPI003A8F9F14